MIENCGEKFNGKVKIFERFGASSRVLVSHSFLWSRMDSPKDIKIVSVQQNERNVKVIEKPRGRGTIQRTRADGINPPHGVGRY